MKSKQHLRKSISDDVVVCSNGSPSCIINVKSEMKTSAKSMNGDIVVGSNASSSHVSY